jgi:hypothetical protein
MSDRDWDAELKKIDRHLEAVSDEAMLPAKTATSAPGKAQPQAVQATTSTLGVFLRLTLSVALGVALAFWPYSARCGLGLAAFLASVTTLVVAGGWSAVWTWRHRAVKGHVLSLLLVLWGLVLAGLDVLPRVGYAKPTASHPAIWSCS